MSDNVRDIVDLALDDKPNKAGDVLNDVLVDKLGDKVQDIKNQVSNELFGQEHDPDADMVEVQPELDLEPGVEEEDGEEYQADQEQI